MRETVRAVMVDPAGKAFFVQHAERNPNDRGKWSTAGGGLDEIDVSHEQGLMRELQEEFGQDARSCLSIGPKLHENFRNDRIDHFYAVLFTGIELISRVPAEILDCGWFDLDHLGGMSFYFGFEPALARRSLHFFETLQRDR